MNSDIADHTKAFAAATIAAAALVLLPAGAAHAAGTLPATWQKSFNFTSWTADGYRSDSAAKALQDMRAMGTNQVVLTPTWYMDTATSETVNPDPAKTPSDASLRTAIEEAHALGMQVVLKPHVDVRDGTFRGQIAPVDRGAWFDSYGAMLSHYAELARQDKVQTLVVGTELTSMATDTARFDVLIARARSLFSGRLTYAANWIDGAEQVGFWDRLDAIGIDAYMPLQTRSASPTVTDIEAAWRPYVQRISVLHATTGKPVMFTELGYQSVSGALANPADATGAPDAQLQADAYAAALNVWRSVPWFQGISWWNWEAQPTGDDPATSFSVAGKPASEILRAAQGGTGTALAIQRSESGLPGGVDVLVLVLVTGLTVVLYSRRPMPDELAQGTQTAPSDSRGAFASGRPEGNMAHWAR